jgi:RNA polymerase sigma-70 factor, ECF subfamily
MSGTRQVPTRAIHAAPSDSDIAAEVKSRLATGDQQHARERYGELVLRHQRRANRIAYLYLRDGSDADEAVQDAFVKAFTHIGTFREELSFEVWFTRILVNGCLDRIKARDRRRRWFLPMADLPGGYERQEFAKVTEAPSPEATLLRREQRRWLTDAIQQLPDRQRLVVTLSHFGERTTREVSELTGLNESTVRVHLFRGLRKLRVILSAQEALL